MPAWQVRISMHTDWWLLLAAKLRPQQVEATLKLAPLDYKGLVNSRKGDLGNQTGTAFGCPVELIIFISVQIHNSQDHHRSVAMVFRQASREGRIRKLANT